MGDSYRDSAAEVVSAEAQGAASAERKNKRRKKGKPVDESTLDPAERARRKRQRELREIALRARGEGAEYKQRKAKAKVWKDVNNGTVVPRPSQRQEVPEPKCHKPKADFQVAILPIFWNFKVAEKKMVIASCTKAAALLAADGVSSFVDDSSHSTPGQKMRHWEEKGVKVRLEVGPKDAEQSMCTVARSQVKAGEVAHKVPGVTIGTALLPVVAELLKMKDKDVPMGDWSKYEKQKAARAAGDAAAAAKASGDAPSGGAKKADTDEDSEESEEDAPAAVAVEAAPKALQQGDDLADDFVDTIETEDVSEALTNADRRRMLKKKKKGGLFKNGPVSDEAPAAAASVAAPEEPKKKAKVVKF